MVAQEDKATPDVDAGGAAPASLTSDPEPEPVSSNTRTHSSSNDKSSTKDSKDDEFHDAESSSSQSQSDREADAFSAITQARKAAAAAVGKSDRETAAALAIAAARRDAAAKKAAVNARVDNPAPPRKVAAQKDREREQKEQMMAWAQRHREQVVQQNKEKELLQKNHNDPTSPRNVNINDEGRGVRIAGGKRPGAGGGANQRPAQVPRQEGQQRQRGAHPPGPQARLNNQRLPQQARAAGDRQEAAAEEQRWLPKVNVYLPTFLAPAATTASRGWKMALMAVGAVACIGAVSIGTILHAQQQASEQDMAATSSTGTISGLHVTVDEEYMSLMANIFEPRIKGVDVPLFWHIPRCGGGTMMEIMGQCLGLVLASDVGAGNGHDQDTELQIIETDRGSYLNVDVTTTTGIIHAKDLGLVPSGWADVIMTPKLNEALTLFDDTNKRPRLFSMFRDPGIRAYSYFNYISSDPSALEYDPSLSQVDVKDYAAPIAPDRPEFNWVTKTLLNIPGETTHLLNGTTFELAKEILQNKFLVGLLDRKSESYSRFERYFGLTHPEGGWACETDKKNNWANIHVPILDKDSATYSILAAKNSWDMALYQFVEQLFTDQGRAWFHH